MAAYSSFAFFYDELTKNVNYPKRADYILALLEKLNHDSGLTLDLACGTGSLTLELFNRGIDIFGIDSSTEMLSVAKDKSFDVGADILFLCQKMQNLDLYGTIDTAICTLDSINHLKNIDEVKTVFSKVSLFMNSGGYFIFDLNTKFKHKNVLADNIFIYDTDSVYCVWQNHYTESSETVEISLDFFEKQDGNYKRYEEHFSERAYDIDEILNALADSGFVDVQMFSELSFIKPEENCERIVFAAKRGK